MGMASIDDRDLKVDAIHARIASARVEIRHAIALNSRTPCLAGSHEVYRLLAEADRFLNNAAGALPWRTSTAG
jgi:hypothetical protein